MSVLTRVWFGDGKDARLMYDFATKRFMTYKLPKSISKWAMAIMAIGAATAASPYAFSQLIRSSSEYSDKIQPLKYRPDLWKILLIYLVIIIICTLICQFIIELQVERAGAIEADVADMEQVQKYVHAAIKGQRDPLTVSFTFKSKVGTTEFLKEYVRKMFLVWLGILLMLAYGFHLLINENSINGLITTSLMFIILAVFILYAILIFLERFIVEKTYNIDINSED
ncbi:hypothetical protein [Bombilactobacillus thymidiniphilus]|uniref:DUF2721 domain-containing protein n=1 Tax=Bombilactobacillus thymidiniphilus TaxID=2923363 RepID=A0ABY4PBE1_9LACO|nr:hypothetical protein [Bombilactobacillus thymidiniphilus]UQS82988.1 hypothetical protein MOO47_04190 [Bombilactobacillus thymidiniphilus]